jgi:hypothetical protein
MGQTAAQTRNEIVQLRAEMADHVVTLKTASQRPVRVAKFALIIGGGVSLTVVGQLVSRCPSVLVKETTEAIDPDDL